MARLSAIDLAGRTMADKPKKSKWIKKSTETAEARPRADEPKGDAGKTGQRHAKIYDHARSRARRGD